MTTWYKVAWIPPLFAALDAIAPNRDRSSDGTIGDLAHATGVSGHNPDDTTLPQGGRAERTDADSKPEVRAADLDSDLRQSGIDMGTIVAVVLGTPADRDRLIYIIYRGKIYRKANGWKAEVYTGSDPHIEHAHFSGDPASDDDGREWSSILALGADMTDSPAVKATHDRVYSLLVGPTVSQYPEKPTYLMSIDKKIDALIAKVDALAAAAPPAGATLTDLDVERIARAVLDEEHRRTAD